MDETPGVTSAAMFLGENGRMFFLDAMQKWATNTATAIEMVTAMMPPPTEADLARRAAYEAAMDTMRAWHRTMCDAPTAGTGTLSERIIADHTPDDHGGHYCTSVLCRTDGEFDDPQEWPCPILTTYGPYLPDWPAAAAEVLA